MLKDALITLLYIYMAIYGFIIPLIVFHWVRFVREENENKQLFTNDKYYDYERWLNVQKEKWRR